MLWWLKAHFIESSTDKLQSLIRMISEMIRLNCPCNRSYCRSVCKVSLFAPFICQWSILRKKFLPLKFAFLFIRTEGISALHILFHQGATCFFLSIVHLKIVTFLFIENKMGLIHYCTLVFDIDAIVLHANPDYSGGKNYVLHIVISVSPFLMLKYTIYRY